MLPLCIVKFALANSWTVFDCLPAVKGACAKIKGTLFGHLVNVEVVCPPAGVCVLVSGRGVGFAAGQALKHVVSADSASVAHREGCTSDRPLPGTVGDARNSIPRICLGLGLGAPTFEVNSLCGAEFGPEVSAGPYCLALGVAAGATI